MVQTKLGVWNANGLQQHFLELKTFIISNKIDIVLVSETHFTEKNYISIPNFKVYTTNHPSGTARGGTAIIIRNSISHSSNVEFKSEHIQSTSVSVKFSGEIITVASIYCPPRHSIKLEQYVEFFQTLGNKFIAGGDYNAKHTIWGSRLVTPKGRTLFKSMQTLNLKHVSSGSPT